MMYESLYEKTAEILLMFHERRQVFVNKITLQKRNRSSATRRVREHTGSLIEVYVYNNKNNFCVK